MLDQTVKNQIIGRKLKNIRLQKVLTQLEVGNSMKLNRNYISKIEAGKARLTLSLLETLVKGLKIKSSDLLDF